MIEHPDDLLKQQFIFHLYCSLNTLEYSIQDKKNYCWNERIRGNGNIKPFAIDILSVITPLSRGKFQLISFYLYIATRDGPCVSRLEFIKLCILY